MFFFHVFFYFFPCIFFSCIFRWIFCKYFGRMFFKRTQKSQRLVHIFIPFACIHNLAPLPPDPPQCMQARSLLGGNIIPEPSRMTNKIMSLTRKGSIHVSRFHFDHALEAISSQSQNSPSVAKNKSVSRTERTPRRKAPESGRVEFMGVGGVATNNPSSHPPIHHSSNSFFHPSTHPSFHPSALLSSLMQLTTSAWGTACCHRGLWSVQHEDVTRDVVSMVARLLDILFFTLPPFSTLLSSSTLPPSSTLPASSTLPQNGGDDDAGREDEDDDDDDDCHQSRCNPGFRLPPPSLPAPTLAQLHWNY